MQVIFWSIKFDHFKVHLVLKMNRHFCFVLGFLCEGLRYIVYKLKFLLFLFINLIKVDMINELNARINLACEQVSRQMNEQHQLIRFFTDFFNCLLNQLQALLLYFHRLIRVLLRGFLSNCWCTFRAQFYPRGYWALPVCPYHQRLILLYFHYHLYDSVQSLYSSYIPRSHDPFY